MLIAHERSHLLIVDDDPVLRSIAAAILVHAGFEVCEAASGEEAMERIGARRYDLVLLDVVMPGLNGYQVCERIRATAQGALIPILMLTGLNDTTAIALSYRHGATDFITKPINTTLLPHKVRYALRASAAVEEMRRGRESLARAQQLACMGNWTLLAGGRMEASEELLRLLGLPGDSTEMPSAERFLEFVVAADRETVRAARTRLMDAGTAYQLTFQILRVDGATRTVREYAARLPNGSGGVTSVEGITQDISEQAWAQQRIRELTAFDATTGLPNRQFFAELAAPSLARATRHGTGCALLHLDIDRFKAVIDAFGSAQGDEVLKTVAERLRTWTRNRDLAAADQRPANGGVLANAGGNAFTLLVTNISSQEQATAMAQRLLGALLQPIMVQGQSLVLTMSIGIALYPEDAEDLAGLAHRAEQALHAATEAGGAQYRFFDRRMNVRAATRLRMEAELRGAIDRDELRLEFQPKVDARSGAIIGAEALVRWQHPERGLLGPYEFIGLAEETGLILPLTDWVLKCACRRLREWSDAGLPRVPLSVNLSARSLTDPTLVDKLDTWISQFDLRPADLMLEVTETMLMRDVESSIALLHTLRGKGFGLSLDDFGTGYSSLSYLTRLPLDELKIDRSFVTDVARGGRSGALAGLIIALGRELGLHVVAEGVETSEQSAFMLRRGCNVQQGYLFSRPVPTEAFVPLLRAGVTVAPSASFVGHQADRIV
jgi:diguanylate cyclase (GGDEF)-like protein